MTAFLGLATFATGIGFVLCIAAAWSHGRRTGWAQRKLYDAKARSKFRKGVEALQYNPDTACYELSIDEHANTNNKRIASHR